MTETLTVRAADAETAARSSEEMDGVLTCAQIRTVTHDVKSFVFRRPGGAALRFAPGQYLAFTVDLGGKSVERCYTISSSPALQGLLSITVKRVPGGPVSNWLHDRLGVGDEVRATGPFGEFSNVYHPARKYLFLSAGSGITPLMSMTRALHESTHPADVVFVHSARTPDDIIFRSELEALAERAGMSVTVVCEADSPGERWPGARGRLSPSFLHTIAPDLLDREVFTCGPVAYMEAVREALDIWGVDPTRRHEESFHLCVPTSESRVVENSAQRYRVELRRSGRVIDCDGATTILDAALEAGVSLPSSCEAGVCGTCKSTLLGGRVDMQHAGGIRPREIERNTILPCCSRPLDDIVLDA